MTARKVRRRGAPPDSTYLCDLRGYYHWDSYEAPLTRTDLAMHEIHLALFAHHPRWVWALPARALSCAT